MVASIAPTLFDRFRSRFTGTPARAYAVRRAAREDLGRLQDQRLQLTQRLSEDVELLDRYVNPLERYLDGDRLLTPLGTILDRRGGKNLPLVWTELDLREFRRWARVICDVNPYAIGFLGVLTDYHLRLGFAWHAHPRGFSGAEDPGREDPLVRLVQAALDEWRDRVQWPIRSREAFRRWHRDGEVFLRFFRGDRDQLPEFRFVEPEQVGPPPGGQDSNERWSFGILTDPDDVMRLHAYFVRHPLGTGSDGDEVPAARIIHLKCNVDSTIKRGITSFLPVQDDLEHVRKLIRNLGEVGGIQSAIAWVAQYAMATPQQVATLIGAGADYTRPKLGSPSGQLMNVARYEPGTVIHMDQNRQFLAGPGSTNAQAHIAILQAILRGVGFRFRMPEWVSGDASNNTYNSALIAGAPLTNMVEAGQQEWGVLERGTACKVIELSVESGRLPREALERVDVRAVPPAVVQATRDQENAIYESQNRAGVLSVTTWRQKVGLINAQEDGNFAAEKKKQTPAGGAPPGGAPPGGAPPGGGPSPSPLTALFSEGFTGTLTDAAGHRRTYVDGKQVANPQDGTGTASQGNPHPPAKWPDHPAGSMLSKALSHSSGLTPEQHHEYTQAAAGVLNRMPARARDRIAESLKGPTRFYSDPKALALGAIETAAKSGNLHPDQVAKLQARKTRIESGQEVMGGAFLRSGGGSLHLDGGFGDSRMPAGVHGGRHQVAAEVYAHELGHAIDGPSFVASSSKPWTDAWESEIGPASRKGDEPSRLCEYAETDRHEGWAEFCRLVYGGQVELKRVETEFPRCAGIFKKAGLWPS